MFNVGVGPTSCFTRAISSITREVKIKTIGRPFDHVIEVDMKRAAAKLPRTKLSINDKLHHEVAEQLGLFDRKYDMVDAELLYYSYDDDMEAKDGMADYSLRLRELLTTLVPQIIEKLWSKNYLLVVENLDLPISPIKLGDFTEGLWFPPPTWKNSFWLVSTTSQNVYERSKPSYDPVIKSFNGDDILMLTLYSLTQAAEYISHAVVGQQENEYYWHRVAIQCFHYATMVLIPHSSNVDPPDQLGVVTNEVINSDKLIHHWASQGIFDDIMKQSIPDTADGDDIYQVGNVILEAFREYSLLQLPSSPAKQGDEATKSAAHFFAYHSLIAEHLTLDELSEENNQHELLERTQWIPHVGDQGWHLSREWLRQGSSGPTALIIKHCSQQSKLFMKLESDHFFAKFPCLRVLDLSYTPLKSLPPSICYLQELQYLSLRGCYNLTSPFSFPNTETTLNLLFFDLSYSNINVFHSDFFYTMPNLQALVLVMCSNLEELPPSFSVLSSLRSFSLIGTSQMKQLSLRGFTKLEYVDIKEVGSLEELDLSATAIKELPDTIPNLPKLKQLLLLGVPSLIRFPWHKLQSLPDVFCLDQCSNSNINHLDHPHGAQVCVSDSRLFYSFNDATRDSVRAGKLLATFFVRVTSCKAASTSKQLKDEADMLMINKLQVAPPAYDDVNRRYLTDGVSMVSMDDVPPCRVSERHVEISAVDLYPHGLRYLLSVTKSISMWDDTHVSCLNDLSDLDELEDCKLQRCHKTVHVFSGDTNTWHLRENMKNAFVSHLKCLTHFYYRPSVYPYPFYALKHLVLKHCPRLEGIVPRDCELPRLETLDILFCYNLKAIFYDNGDQSSSAGYELPCLRRIHLQELPLLEDLHVDNLMLSAPRWKELHVRGCWSLRRLPRFRQQPDKAVKVSGERAWWNKLRWDGAHSHHADSYKPMLPQAFASHRERVIIESYLR